jgi:hypothetical protein
VLVYPGHESAKRDDLRADLSIEAHDRTRAADVPEHPDAAAQADALAHPRFALATVARMIVHLVWLPLIWVEAYGGRILSVGC